MNVVYKSDEGIVNLEFVSSTAPQDLKEKLLLWGDAALRLANHYREKDGSMPQVLTVAVYTSDITSAPDQLDLGSISMKVRQVFFSAFDGNEWLRPIMAKVQSGEELSNLDRVKLTLAPLTGTAKSDPSFLENCFDTAWKDLKDPAMTLKIIAHMYVAGHELIEAPLKDKLAGWLIMNDYKKA